MEDVFGLLGLILIVVVCAYAAGAVFVALWAAGYFLSIPMLLSLTGLLLAVFGLWWLDVQRGDHYYRRMGRLKFWAALTFLAVLVIWIVAAFQTEQVQHWWEVASHWMFRSNVDVP